MEQSVLPDNMEPARVMKAEWAARATTATHLLNMAEVRVLECTSRAVVQVITTRDKDTTSSSINKEIHIIMDLLKADMRKVTRVVADIIHHTVAMKACIRADMKAGQTRILTAGSGVKATVAAVRKTAVMEMTTHAEVMEPQLAAMVQATVDMAAVAMEVIPATAVHQATTATVTAGMATEARSLTAAAVSASTMTIHNTANLREAMAREGKWIVMSHAAKAEGIVLQVPAALTGKLKSISIQDSDPAIHPGIYCRDGFFMP